MHNYKQMVGYPNFMKYTHVACYDTVLTVKAFRIKNLHTLFLCVGARLINHESTAGSY